MCPERHLFPLFLGNIRSKGLFQWMDTGKQTSPQIVPPDSTSATDTGEFTRDKVLVQANNFFPPRDHMLTSTAFTISAGHGGDNARPFNEKADGTNVLLELLVTPVAPGICPTNS